MKFITKNRFIIAAILLFTFFFSFSYMSSHGANILGFKVTPETITYDEVAHIAASFQYDHDLAMVLNPEHPILIKALVGIPLQFLKINPTTFTASNLLSDINEHQWDYGNQLIFQNNPSKSEHIVSIARTTVLAINLILLIIAFLLCLKFFGRKTALILLSLITFNPSLLGHATLVTFDVPALLTAIITILCFIGLTRENNYKWAIYTGLAAGIAAVTKYSSIAIIVFLPIYYLIIAAFKNNKEHQFVIKLKYMVAYGFTLVLFIILIYTPYTFKISAQQEMYQVLNTWPGHLNLFAKPLITFLDNLSAPTRALGLWINGLFILNLEVGVFRAGVFFMNNVYTQPTFLLPYFPIVFLTKSTVGYLLAIITGIFLLIPRFFKNSKKNVGEEIIVLIYSVLYFCLALYSKLKLGVRHLFPAVGSFALFSAIILNNNWSSKIKKTKISTLTYIFIGLSFIATIYSFPHFISFYNLPSGGINNGYKIAEDSNYDWGQDMLYVRNWKSSHPNAHLYLNLFSAGGVQSHYFGDNPNLYVSWYNNNLPAGSFIAVDSNIIASDQVNQHISYKDIYKKQIIRLTPTIFIFEK